MDNAIITACRCGLGVVLVLLKCHSDDNIKVVLTDQGCLLVHIM